MVPHSKFLDIDEKIIWRLNMKLSTKLLICATNICLISGIKNSKGVPTPCLTLKIKSLFWLKKKVGRNQTPDGGYGYGIRTRTSKSKLLRTPTRNRKNNWNIISTRIVYEPCNIPYPYTFRTFFFKIFPYP